MTTITFKTSSGPSGAIVFAAILVTDAFAWDTDPIVSLVCASVFGIIAGALAWLKDN